MWSYELDDESRRKCHSGESQYDTVRQYLRMSNEIATDVEELTRSTTMHNDVERYSFLIAENKNDLGRIRQRCTPM